MSVVALRKPRPAPTRPEAPLPAPGRRRWPLALVCVFAVAALYHWLQSLGHATPAIFTDELLFSELARSFAAGDGFTVRGQPLFFPAFVPSLLQAPVWLVGPVPAAYGVAKALNALLMCSAAFPAYWLARQLVARREALIVAVATVTGGAMLYHGYLTSEAAAYPVFLLALAVCVRALAVPSPRRDLVAVAVLALAAATRAQFVVLPVAFAVAILLVGRPLRRHAVALAVLAAGAVAALLVGFSGLGFYAGAGEIEYPLGETLRWSGWTAALLPFAAGLLVVPSALFGLGLGVLRPRGGAERAFAALTVLLLVLMPLQAGLIASGEAHKPFERYTFYLLPLVFVAFFAFVQRDDAPRRPYTAAALAVGGLALAVPFASLALDPFSFDSPTLSAVAALGRWTSPGDAAALLAAAGLLAALGAIVLRRRPHVVAAVSILLALALGAAAYSGDRRMTERSLASLAPRSPDWLERLEVPEADVLALPGGSLHAGWMLESWNRNVGRTFHLGDVPPDPLPYRQVAVGPDGSLPVHSRYLVVDESGTQVDLDAAEVARPKPGLALYRTSGRVRFRSVSFGLYADGWAQSVLRHAAFPGRRAAGAYRVTLALPAGRLPRHLVLEAGPVRRTVELQSGASVTVRIPASGYPLPELAIRTNRADFVGAGTPRPRLVALRVRALAFDVSRLGGARLKPGTAGSDEGSRN
jgi:hypothetical protein